MRAHPVRFMSPRVSGRLPQNEPPDWMMNLAPDSPFRLKEVLSGSLYYPAIGTEGKPGPRPRLLRTKLYVWKLTYITFRFLRCPLLRGDDGNAEHMSTGKGV